MAFMDFISCVNPLDFMLTLLFFLIKEYNLNIKPTFSVKYSYIGILCRPLISYT